jgi:ketosteroid isomerase-like protein
LSFYNFFPIERTIQMDIKEKITALFKTIDEMDADKFVNFVTDDAQFRFGNAPAAVGKAAIKEAVAGFFTTIKGISHKNVNLWVMPGHTIYEGEVTYTRHDGSKLTIPFLNVFGMAGDLIKDYFIYIDINPLYNPQ